MAGITWSQSLVVSAFQSFRKGHENFPVSNDGTISYLISQQHFLSASSVNMPLDILQFVNKKLQVSATDIWTLVPTLEFWSHWLVKVGGVKPATGYWERAVGGKSLSPGYRNGKLKSQRISETGKEEERERETIMCLWLSSLSSTPISV